MTRGGLFILIFVEFPLIDYRYFIDGEVGQLPLPNWDNPSIGDSFVRSHGPVVKRSKGGIPGWFGESRVAISSNIVKFPNRTTLSCNDIVHRGKKDDIDIVLLSRTFFADGLGLCKYDFVFGTRPTSSYIYSPEGEPTIHEYLNPLFKSNVQIKLPLETSAGSTFEQMIPYLTEAYFRSSTSSEYLKNNPEVNWQEYIGFAKPIIYIDVSEKEVVILPKQSKTVYSTKYTGIQLSTFQTEFMSKEIPVWVATKHLNFNLTKAGQRYLRLFVLRLHTEYQVLQKVMDSVATKKIDPSQFSEASENLQLYLGELNKRLKVKSNKNISKDELINIEDFVKLSLEKTEPGQRDQVLKAISRMKLRRQVSQNTLQVAETILNIKDSTVNMQQHEGEGDNIIAQGDNPIGKVEADRDVALYINNLKQSIAEDFDSESILEELETLKEHVQSSFAADMSEPVAEQLDTAKDLVKADDKDGFAQLFQNLPAWALGAIRTLGLTILGRYLASLLGL